VSGTSEERLRLRSPSARVRRLRGSSPRRRAQRDAGDTRDRGREPGSRSPAFRTQGHDWAWSGLGGLFREDDLTVSNTVINLECPATDVSALLAKTFVFRCDPAALPVAERFGVEVANLANNHAYDHAPGLLDSIRNVRTAGLAPVGRGRTGTRHSGRPTSAFTVEGGGRGHRRGRRPRLPGGRAGHAGSRGRARLGAGAPRHPATPRDEPTSSSCPSTEAWSSTPIPAGTGWTRTG